MSNFVQIDGEHVGKLDKAVSFLETDCGAASVGSGNECLVLSTERNQVSSRMSLRCLPNYLINSLDKTKHC